MAIGMQQTVRVNGLLLIVFLLAGLTGCGSGGTKKDIETDASVEADAIVDEPDVDVAPQPAEEIAIEDVIGHYMDQQAEELSTIEGAKTARLNETILMTWDYDILFSFDSAMLNTDAQSQIERMADVFQRYPDTRIIVAGHTDSQGDEDYNFTLSERRALSVRNYLIDAGVPPERIETVGFGEFRPVTTNNTEKGRNLNRRIEIEVRPDETLKSRAAAVDSTH